MKKRGRRRIRSPEYWRAYYRQKQREWRAAHYWQADYTRKQREQRAARQLTGKRRKRKTAPRTADRADAKISGSATSISKSESRRAVDESCSPDRCKPS